MAALAFGLGGLFTVRGPLLSLAGWLGEARSRPPLAPSLDALLDVPAWLVVAAAILAIAALFRRLPPVPREPGAWPWSATGVVLGAAGVLAWLTGAAAGWAWGLSMTGPSRSLVEAVLGRTVAPLSWGTAMLVGCRSARS